MTEAEELEYLTLKRKRALAQQDATQAVEPETTIPQKIVRGGLGMAQDLLALHKAQGVGVGRGLTNAYENIRQLLSGTDSEFSRRAQEERDLYAMAKAQESGMTRFAMGSGELIGETAPYAAIPGAAVSAGLPTRLAAGMAGGGLMGATQFVHPETQDPMRQRVSGGALGVFTGGLGTLGLEPLRLASSKMRGVMAPDERGLVEASEKFDVPLSFADVRGGPTTKLETMLESAPIIGMGRFRAVQQQKAGKAAEVFAKDFSDRINGSWEGVAKDSLNSRLDALKTVSNALYTKLAKKADPVGAVQMPKTMQTIQDAIAKEKTALQPDTALIADLEEKFAGLSTKSGNFSQVRDFRSAISDQISDFYGGKNALVGKRGVGKLQEIRDSINEDMESFAKQQGGDIYRDWKAADTFYKQKVIPYREQAFIRRLAKEDDPTASYNLFLSAAKQKPDMLYNAIGMKGQAAIKSGILSDALEISMKEKTGFSPARFAQSLEKRQNEIGIFFKGKDKAEIEGLMRVMRHAERAGQYAENPPTGNRLLPWLLGGAMGIGAVTTPTAVAVAGSGMYGLSKLLTSKSGRNFLLSSSRVEPGPAMQRLIDNYAPKIAAEMAVGDE